MFQVTTSLCFLLLFVCLLVCFFFVVTNVLCLCFLNLWEVNANEKTLETALVIIISYIERSTVITENNSKIFCYQLSQDFPVQSQNVFSCFLSNFVAKIFFKKSLLGLLLARTFYIRRSNNNVDSIETGRIVIGHVLP